MMRLLILLSLVMSSAAAQIPLPQRVAEELRSYALLPDDAEIRMLHITPVRGAVETVSITRYNRNTGHFEANIAHGSNQASISGRASVSIPVVVASQTLRRDHVITAADVEIRQISVAQIPSNAFLFEEEVIGSSVRRSLGGGRPIRPTDIGLPIIVRKNEAIEIIYETNAMTLVARGRALQEGARGDFISIVTDGQGLTVTGEVTQPGRVVVR